MFSTVKECILDMKLNPLPFLTAALFLATLPCSAQAQYTNFHVSIDTSGLPTLPAGDSYNLDFELNGTNGSSDLLNTFNLGGGSVTGSPALTNAVRGSIGAGSISMGQTSSTNFINQYTDGFTPGGGPLTFNVSLSPVVGTTPDNFVFGLYDTNGAFISTGPAGYELATLDLSKNSFGAPDWNTYSYSGTNGTVTTMVTPFSPGISTPEAGSATGLGMMVMAGLMGSGIRRRKCTK